MTNLAKKLAATVLGALAVCASAACGPPAAPPEQLTIVHVSDLHARYQPRRDGVSRYARLKGYVERVRAEHPHTLFTGGGDDYEKGSIAEQLSAGRATTEITHALGFDLRVLGNHDLAWGASELLDYVSPDGGEVLASNTVYRGSDPRGFRALRTSRRDFGELRVGFFGFVSRPWDEKNEQYDGDYLPGFETRYEYEALAAEIVDELEEEVDLVVMLSHLGIGLDRRVAERVDGIDLILGSHSHFTTEQPERVGDSIIVHPGWGGRKLARLDLSYDFDDEELAVHRFQIIGITADLGPPDAEMQRAVRRAYQRHAPRAGSTVARVSAPHDERQIAQLTAEALRGLPCVDVALIDPETVWTTWRRGALSWERLHRTFLVERQPPNTPGFNSVYLAELRAADLELLEARLPPGWGYARAGDIGANANVRLAIQRHAAYHPDVILAPDVEIGAPTFLGETWSLLGEHGQRRHRRCLHLDSGARVSDCRPLETAR